MDTIVENGGAAISNTLQNHWGANAAVREESFDNSKEAITGGRAFREVYLGVHRKPARTQP